MRYIFVFFVLCRFTSYSQEINCNLVLSGTIKDLHDGESIPFTKVTIKETKVSTQSDSTGYFLFNNLCEGIYTLHFKNGLHPMDTTLFLQENTTIEIEFETHVEQMEEILLQARIVRKQDVESLQKIELSGIELDKTRGSSLGESLKSITGVNSVQTGPSISKPMIHGLYGNRLVILNNGIRLEGQNWGSDHAPEIDPFVASKLTVIKGASSIRYGMEALGGVVLVDSKDLMNIKKMQGELNVIAMSNGQSGTISSYMEGTLGKKLRGFTWCLQETTRKGGTYKTPTYYLTNSGLNEVNYSGTLNYSRKKFNSTIYFSSFNSQIGIYTGGEASSVEELLAAFNATTPSVPSQFSYLIHKAYQTIHHDILKMKMDYQFKKIGKLYLTLASQENRRSEFEDELSAGPDAYFKLRSQTLDVVFEHKPIRIINGSIGVSGMVQKNTFNGTEERRVVPNYMNYTGGIFILEKVQLRKLLFEAGVRYDVKKMRVENINYTSQQTYINSLYWSNFTGTLGLVYRPNKKNSINTSFGVGWRPPSAIELYAYGIHQSAASFEIGDSTLQAEQSYNLQSYYTYAAKKLNVEIGVYYNQMNHFIYLNPTGIPIVTDAGVFPGLKYQQGNVFFTGIDANLSYALFSKLDIAAKTSLLYAYNQTIHDYLINTPSNRISIDLKLHSPSLKKLIEPYFQTSFLMVSKQYNVPQNVDYVASPKGYSLLNFDAGTSLKVNGQLISFNLSVTNALNTVYRDYLNRFRYFSNEVGRNIVLRVKVPF